MECVRIRWIVSLLFFLFAIQSYSTQSGSLTIIFYLCHRSCDINHPHMTPLKAITISCLSLSLRSVTSTFNQQLLLSKSFSSTTKTMEQSILDAIGKISLSPIDKGALKDETKIDAGNQLLILTSYSTTSTQ